MDTLNLVFFYAKSALEEHEIHKDGYAMHVCKPRMQRLLGGLLDAATFIFLFEKIKKIFEYS
jgi:hypothetical protein